jgi:hypothetical protein
MRVKLRTPRQWRRSRRALVAIAVAGLLVTVLGQLSPGLAIFGLALLGLTLLEAAQVRRSILESNRQHFALVQVRPLLGDLPLDLSGWSADPVFVHNVVRLLIETRPALVVECGSGSSTVVVARCLRALGHGRIVSLDHDPVYAERSRGLLRLHGVEDVASVVTAPLAPREVKGRQFQWYAPTYAALLNGSIDLLLVDGPPGKSAPRARYPAVPLLLPHLAPACAIVLDDGDRQDERAIAHAWAQELDATLVYLEGGRGGWMLRRR